MSKNFGCRFDRFILNPLIKNIKVLKNNNALCINEILFTYQQLGENISKIRNSLKDFGDDQVYYGLVVNDDIETYASIFALWLEGKAYVPLHPKQPKERNVEIINQVEISYILDSGNSTVYQEYSVVLTSKLVYRQDF